MTTNAMPLSGGRFAEKRLQGGESAGRTAEAHDRTHLVAARGDDVVEQLAVLLFDDVG